MKKLYLIRTNKNTGGRDVYPYSTDEEKRDFCKIEDLDGISGYQYLYRYLDESEIIYVVIGYYHPVNANVDVYLLGSYSTLFDAENKYREMKHKYAGNTDFSLFIATSVCL